jgi:hypothetical protein
MYAQFGRTSGDRHRVFICRSAKRAFHQQRAAALECEVLEI